MSSKKMLAILLFAIGILIAVVSLVFTYTGLPGGLDTEPLLSAAIILVALAGLMSIKE